MLIPDVVVTAQASVLLTVPVPVEMMAWGSGEGWEGNTKGSYHGIFPRSRHFSV